MSFLGKHTTDELRDLVRAFDYTTRQIQSDADAFAPAWLARSPETARAWNAEWLAFRERYAAARKPALVKIALASAAPVVPLSVVPAEDEYESVRRAVKQDPDGAYVQGDLQDLYNRLAEAQRRPVDFSQLPQPSGDADLAVMNTIGSTATFLRQAKKDFFADPDARDLMLYVGGGLLALGALLVLTRR